MAGSFAVSIVVGLKDQASRGLKSVTRGLKTDLRGAVQGARGEFRALGRRVVSLGDTFWRFGRRAIGFAVDQFKRLVRWAKLAGIAVAAAFILATTQASGFADVMMDVEIQSGATAEQMAAIKASAFERDFARLGKTATDVGGSYKRLAAEGYEVVQMQEMLQPILETSIALGTEEAETTKLMLNLMEQFNLEARDMAHISDVLASALAETSFQGQELAETMKMAGVAGRMAGWSLEGTIAVTDRIIKVTGEASLAGRYYRQLMFSMMAPTKRMAGEFARVGISLDEIADASKDPIKLARLLTKAHDRGINFARAYGSIAAVAAAALVDEANAIEAVRDALGKSGAAHDAAIKKSTTLGGLVRGGIALFKNLLVVVGQGFVPAAKLGASALSDLIGGLIESGRARDFGATLGKAALAATQFVIAFARGDVVKRWFAFFRIGFAELGALLAGAENRFDEWATRLGQEVRRGILSAIMAIGPIVAQMVDNLFGPGTWAQAREMLIELGLVGKAAFGTMMEVLPHLADAIVAIGPHVAGVVKWLLDFTKAHPQVAAYIVTFLLIASALAPITGGLGEIIGLVVACGVPLLVVLKIVGAIALAVAAVVLWWRNALVAMETYKLVGERLAQDEARRKEYYTPDIQAEIAAVKPTFSQRVQGIFMEGGETGYTIARHEYEMARGYTPEERQEMAAYRRGQPAVQGPGVARPEVTVPVNVYIGNEQLDARQRRVAVGVVREAVDGAR